MGATIIMIILITTSIIIFGISTNATRVRIRLNIQGQVSTL